MKKARITLIAQNKYLRDKKTRQKMTDISVRNSSLIEGIHYPAVGLSANRKTSVR
jgi:hypothetical protein